MRITRIERGTVVGVNYDGTYTEVYTQPVSRVAASWLYDKIWVKLTWRFYRWLWKVLPHQPEWLKFSDGQEYDVSMPFINRQDERSFDLCHGDRVQISLTYDPPKPKVVGWSCEHINMTGTGIIGPPSTNLCNCQMRPVYA